MSEPLTFEELKQEIGRRSISQLPALLLCISRHCGMKPVFKDKAAFLEVASRAYDMGPVGLAELRKEV